MASPVQPITAAVHGPYEDLAIEGLRLIEKLIDGQTPAQKALIWQQWIDFWKPLMEIGKTFGK
jgi:hypothetical protein